MNSTSVSSQALALTRQALDEFDSVPLSSSIRRSLRIARLCGDWTAVWWLDMEAVDTNRRDGLARKTEMAGYFTPEELDRVHEDVVQEFTNTRRTTPGDGSASGGEEKVLVWSVEQMEGNRA